MTILFKKDDGIAFWAGLLVCGALQCLAERVEGQRAPAQQPGADPTGFDSHPLVRLEAMRAYLSGIRHNQGAKDHVVRRMGDAS